MVADSNSVFHRCGGNFYGLNNEGHAEKRHDDGDHRGFKYSRIMVFGGPGSASTFVCRPRPFGLTEREVNTLAFSRVVSSVETVLSIIANIVEAGQQRVKRRKFDSVVFS